MIERLIYIALTQGIEDVLAEPRVLERYFAEQNLLSSDEIAAIRGYFEANAPSVIHSYPRMDSKFPLYAIVLGSENESDQFLGDEGNDVFDRDDPDDGATTTVAIFERTYQVYVVSDGPDKTIYLYELAKFFLFRALDFFKANGALVARFSGNDLAPDPRYIPAHLFVRQLNITMSEEHRQIGVKPARGFRIDGVFVESTPNVLAQVTVDTAEE